MHHVDRIILYAVGILATLIAVLDFLGFDVLPAQQLGELMLLTVGAVALHSARQDAKLLRIVRNTDAAPAIILNALKGVRFQEFHDASAYWSYLSQRVKMAEKSVDDLTWGRTPTAQTTKAAKEAYLKYRRTIETVARGRGRHDQVVYREIMSFPHGYRIGRARTLLDESFENYHLRFYDYDHGGTPRLIQFVLVDQEELLVGIHGETGLAGKFISIESAGLVEAMAVYFEICWREAVPLKDERGVEREVWNSLENRFPEVHT